MLHIIIPPLTPLWWKMILFSALIICLPIILAKYYPGKTDLIRKFLGSIFVSTAILIHPFLIATGAWKLQSSLPLQLCSLSGILSGVVLLYPTQLGYEFLMYWGISGAVHSLITPELTQGNGNFILFEYYISHSGIIGSGLFLTFCCNIGLRKNSWIKIFLFTQLLLPVIGMADYFLDANYMYLRSRPEVNNPLIIGKWPLYLICFEALLLIHFYIVYLLFYRAPKRALNVNN